MAGYDYHVIGLVRGKTCNVDAAIAALSKMGFKAERTQTESAIGFRVVEEDGWGIVAWIEDDEDALEIVSDVSKVPPDGVTTADIESCQVTLSIWSDDDPEFMNAHVFEEFIQCLKDACGYYMFDNRLGEWR